MFKLNFKIALRNLWKRKGFSLINIGGLAIGLSSCLMLLLYVNYEWSYDKQFKDIDRIYSICKNVSNGADLNATLGPISNALPSIVAATALQTMPGVSYASRYFWDYKLVNYHQNRFKLSALFADPSFLNIFNYKFIHGDPSTALNTPSSILITASTAKKLFGNANPIGKIIRWENREGLNVTAVIEDLPHNQSIQFEALLSWQFLVKENSWINDTEWNVGFANIAIKLKDNRNFAAADAVLRKMIKANAKNDKFTEPFLFPFSKTHLYTQFENGKATGGKIDQVRLFLFLACCVLFIACINYMNLSTAQSEKRAREVGVRKALGATRKAIAGQFMLESMILSFLAMVIAFILVEVTLPYFNHLLDIYILIDYRSAPSWGVMAGLILLTGLLAGSYPSFYLSSFIPVKVLKGFTGIGRSSLPVRKILVVVQFGFSVCMIICAVMVYSQIRFIRNKPLGFNKDNLVQIEKAGELANPGKLEVFKKELIRSGAVIAATEYSTSITAGANNSSDIVWAGHPDNGKYSWNNRITGYDFVKTLGAELLEGRDFSRSFGSDTSAVLVNETAAKLMEFKNPVGSQITKAGKVYTIIGVLKDYSYESAAYKVKPTLTFLPNPGRPFMQTYMVFLRLNPAQNLSQSVQKIRDISSGMNPAYPTELWFASQDIADKLADEKLLSTLSTIFGGFAIFISCLGLLGLALYMAEQRSKEISIRKVLGADLRNILVLLNKDFMKLVILSNVIACPVAYIIAYKWLQHYDYRVTITIWPMVSTVALSVFIAVLTISLQTFKVAKANPVDALKYE